MMDESGKVVVLHGFTKDEAFTLMRLIRSQGAVEDVAFAMSTPTNLDWKLEALVKEVREEHEFMKKKS